MLEELEVRVGEQAPELSGQPVGAAVVPVEHVLRAVLHLVAGTGDEAPERGEAVVRDASGARHVTVRVGEEVAGGDGFEPVRVLGGDEQLGDAFSTRAKRLLVSPTMRSTRSCTSGSCDSDL